MQIHHATWQWADKTVVHSMTVKSLTDAMGKISAQHGATLTYGTDSELSIPLSACACFFPPEMLMRNMILGAHSKNCLQMQ